MPRTCLKSLLTDGYVRMVGQAASFNFGLGDFSICAWIKTSTYVGDVFFDTSIFNSSGPVVGSSRFLVTGDLGLGFFDMGKSGSTVSITGSTRISGDPGLNNWKWHFICVTCVRNSAIGLRLYVDGIEDSSPVNPTSLVATNFVWATNNVYLDNYFGNYSDNADGQFVEQIRFYKTALTSSQQLAIYNQGVGIVVNETDFAAISDGWYSEFNDGSGTVLSGRKCSSGTWSASNGTIIGLPTYIDWYSDGIPFPDTNTGGSAMMSDIDDSLWNW